MHIKGTTLGASLAMVSMMGTLIAPGVAHASKEGRKNTAIGLGAAAAHQILTGKTRNGILLGAGAAYAYKRYKDAERSENRQRRAATYRSNRTAGGATTYRSRQTARTRSSNRYGAASATGRTYPESRTTHVPNGSYYFTGRVLNDATELTNRVITVDHNGVSRRVSVPRSATVLHGSERISMHDIRNGDMVRVLAVRTKSGSWNASKVELLNAVDADVAVRTRDEFGDTYTRRGGASTRYEESRSRYDNDTRTRYDEATTRYNGTGIVERVSADGRSFVVQVGTTRRTVLTGDADFRGVSGTHDLREGDRVRVVGEIEGRDVIAREVSLLD